jgi:hypothetical protein
MNIEIVEIPQIKQGKDKIIHFYIDSRQSRLLPENAP